MVSAQYDSAQAARNHQTVIRAKGAVNGLRSRRQRQRLLAVALRAQGRTWVEIAATIQRQEKVGALAAFRLAHG